MNSDFFCSVSGAYHNIGSALGNIVHGAYEAMSNSQNAQDEDGRTAIPAFVPTIDHIAKMIADKQARGMHFGTAQLSTKLELLGIKESFQEGLQYREEDKAAARDFVILCPYVMNDDGAIKMHATYGDPRPIEISDATITEVFNIVPGRLADLGEYTNEDPEDYTDYSVISYLSSTLIIAYTSYLILREAVPGIRPWMLYALAEVEEGTSGPIDGVDYGPVSKIFGRRASWPSICTIRDTEDVRPTSFWMKLFTSNVMSNEEKIREAWYGDGNLWVFVRPDRFPISETFSADPLPSFSYNDAEGFGGGSRPTLIRLPPDVLLSICEFVPIRTIYALITTCKRFRSQILPHANSIAFRRLKVDEPWYLPAGPFDLPSSFKKRGREDVDYWEQEWAKGAFDARDVQTGSGKVPWLYYRKACSGSLSMWNRKRIWGIAKQIEKLANERGYL